jgi:hypothetical protein
MFRLFFFAVEARAENMRPHSAFHGCVTAPCFSSRPRVSRTTFATLQYKVNISQPFLSKDFHLNIFCLSSRPPHHLFSPKKSDNDLVQGKCYGRMSHGRDGRIAGLPQPSASTNRHIVWVFSIFNTSNHLSKALAKSCYYVVARRRASDFAKSPASALASAV